MKKLVKRMDFVENWANFIRKNPAKKWSSMQKKLIDSQIRSAKQIRLTRKQVKFIKKEARK